MPKNEMQAAKRLRLTWVKSGIGYPERQKATIKALGFRKLGSVVEHESTPAVRGMIEKVSHLIKVEEVND